MIDSDIVVDVISREIMVICILPLFIIEIIIFLRLVVSQLHQISIEMVQHIPLQKQAHSICSNCIFRLNVYRCIYIKNCQFL